MVAKIQKWGNSQAIRIPKTILELANLHENDSVEMITEDNKIIIISSMTKQHKTIVERFVDYEGNYDCCEWDTGKSSGNEVL